MKLVYLLIFFVANVTAAPNPPPPSQHSPMSTDNVPPGTPIDDHIILVGSIAVFYGLYVVYSRRKQSAI